MLYFEKTVTIEEDGRMVKSLLSSLNLSRRLRRDLLSGGHIRVNDKPTFLTSRVHVGDQIIVEPVVETNDHFPPESIPLDIAYEDEHLVVINKPPGLLVHPTSRERTGTLASAISFHMEKQGESYRFRPVHRLDRDTSGLLIIAKHKLAHERLSRALRKREIHREYMAFTVGNIQQDKFSICAPIGLSEGSTLKRTVYFEGTSELAKQAITHVHVLHNYIGNLAAKVEITLETGRTHQIRVHLASIGHPIFGDTLYGEIHANEYAPELSRQALHAFKLSFAHPVTEEYIVCESALPDDLRQFEVFLERATSDR